MTAALVDDHELMRLGLAALITSRSTSARVVATAAGVTELRGGPGWGAHLVLLEANLRDGSTVEANVAALTAAGSRVLVLSADDAPGTALRALRAGAHGFLPKSATGAELARSITQMSHGRACPVRGRAPGLPAGATPARPTLSPQELRTLRMYAAGMPLKSVALRLDISEGAVKSYVDRIREKYLKVGREATKVDLYRRAVEDGYLPILGSAQR